MEGLGGSEVSSSITSSGSSLSSGVSSSLSCGSSFASAIDPAKKQVVAVRHTTTKKKKRTNIYKQHDYPQKREKRRVKKLSFDESQQASEVKSPSFFKQSGQICPSSVPPFLPSRKAKITGSEPPLIPADYPFTQRFMSSSARSLELNFKIKSNVLNDKENMEQSANKVEVTEEKPRRDKNEPTL
ncbi:hypothetical protein POM88_052787 [Heracleum sosnowskyi]|uniref:Uncharacterized protein n=1 Tax=Heracleum sosnowskyi TaxID=360622 RepID=A0AAD8GRN2_9APIA|nr:hypothetical protein POM88_052787 [Heracleum sosnowskyi]